MDKMKLVEATQMKSDVPAFGPGDTITVHVRVVEGERLYFVGRTDEREGIGDRAARRIDRHGGNR